MEAAKSQSCPRERHEHVLINGVYSCRYQLRPLQKRKVTSVGQYTGQRDSHGGEPFKGRWAAGDIELASRCPALVEYLTEREDEEGRARTTSTLLVAAEDGVWKVCLTDRASPTGNWDYKAWKSGDTIMEALMALDRDLQENTLEWRKFPKWKPPTRR
jgi:hypothetical protein